MEEEQKNNSIIELIKQHPRASKLTGGFGGVCLFSFVAKLSGIFQSAEPSDIINWGIELVLYVKSIPGIVFVSIIICVFICAYKCMHNKGAFDQKFLDESAKMMQNDSTIVGVTINKNKDGLSINVKREGMDEIDDKNDSKIIDIQSHIKSNK